MTQEQESLLQTLLALDEAVRSKPVGGTNPGMLALFQRLDQLTAGLPKDTDPTLLHYLHKKSYQKARLWLEGKESENQAGNCRHVA